ncbi:hypothetical protein yc1106_09561 [Curvularia clavata]|uniref:Uncharacterized protein n=1 Tax=Curvularia clavata TaxID=95742 RepID=A0A9Q8ZF95_CURCL|nr:hypothetical protein yc1106_09561 [Curvularia clavata]
MKVSIILAALGAAVALASPAAFLLKQVSLERSVKEVRDVDGTATQLSCVECPCDGFSGKCKCIPNGCCCIS